MNPYFPSETGSLTTLDRESTPTEKDLLALADFTAEETLSLLWLRQWYQSGGSDRVPIIRHLEFVKQLVACGRIAS